MVCLDDRLGGFGLDLGKSGRTRVSAAGGTEVTG